MTALPADQAASVGNVVVSFFTTTFPQHMPEQTFSIPLNTLPDGLQKIVDSILDSTKSVPFDFLHNDEYISTTLEKFLRRRSINMEQVIMIEYTPALQAQEGSKMPHDDWVSSVRAPFFGQSAILLTAAYDHCVRLWSNEECVAIGAKHSEAVKEIALHPVAPAPTPSSAVVGSKRRKDVDIAPIRFLSGGKDGKICAWEYRDQALECIGVVQQHVGSVDTVDVSPTTGQLCVSGSWDLSVKVFKWDQILDNTIAADKKSPLLAFTDHARPVLCCRFSQVDPETVVYSTGLDGCIKSWDLSQAELIATYNGDHAINKISVKPSGGSSDLILAACTDNRLRLYDTRQKNVVKTFAGHRQWLYSATWLWRREDGPTSSSNLFASASEDSTVRLWDLRCLSNSLLSLDSLHTDGVLDVTYVGNNEIATGGKDNKTKTFTLQKEMK